MATARRQLEPTHHMVFTIPRTASHLLLKLLNLPAQPSLQRHSNRQDGYIFLPAASPRFRHSLLGKPLHKWTDDERNALKDAMQSSFSSWLHFISDAERQGKSTFVKEHLNWMIDPVAEARSSSTENVYSPTASEFQVTWKPTEYSYAKNAYNVTCIPDAFLLQRIKPTFLIRHPALTFPSSLRTAIDNQGLLTVINDEAIQQWECTYKWSLSLYKFYLESLADFDRKSFVKGVEYPIVLDAQDLDNEALVKKYARVVGLDEDKVQFAWKAAGEEELCSLGMMEKRMKSTILASSGVEKGKLGTNELDLEKLRREWEQEFGEFLSERLVKLVNSSIESYEALRSARLRVEQE